MCLRSGCWAPTTRCASAILGLLVGPVGLVMVTLEDPRVQPNESLSVAVFASATWLAGPSASTQPPTGAGRGAVRGPGTKSTRGARRRSPRSGPGSRGELHDVVAHTRQRDRVQAGRRRGCAEPRPDRAVGGAARGRGDRPAGAGRAAPAARRAAPTRTTAGLAPQPGLPTSRRWSTSVRAAGLDVELAVDGDVAAAAAAASTWRPTGSCRRR